MPKIVEYNLDKLPPFPRWLALTMIRRGVKLKQVSEGTGIDYSQLFKAMHSDRPQYAQNYRLGYENTVKIGQMLGDLAGALNAADYPHNIETPPKPTHLETMQVTPEERAIIEQIRAMMATKAPASEFDLEPHQIGERFDKLRLPPDIGDVRPRSEDRSREVKEK